MNIATQFFMATLGVFLVFLTLVLFGHLSIVFNKASMFDALYSRQVEKTLSQDREKHE
jgi:hypothetical protein